jgi:cell division protein FtsQ
MASFATRGRSEPSIAVRSRPGTEPPSTSRMNLRDAKNRPRGNRRRETPATLWSRVPGPRKIANGCGRIVRRSLPGLAALGIAAVIAGGVYAGYRFVTTSERFAITSIEVRGNSRVTSDELLAALPIHTGDNVFTADLDAAASAVRTNPWIATADVRRILPHTITLEIREHVPAAMVTLGDAYLVDSAGHPFKHAEGPGGLPMITGLDRDAYVRDPEATAHAIRDALAALGAWRADPARIAIDEIRIGRSGDIALRSAETQIRIGRPGPALATRLAAFDAAWAALSDDERARARAVHLDNRPDHVTLAFAAVTKEAPPHGQVQKH